MLKMIYMISDYNKKRLENKFLGEKNYFLKTE